IDGHLRAFRWSVEASFCLLSLWIWMPDVMRRPRWWARYLLGLTLCASLAALIKFVAVDNMQGRLSGFGGLHNPIHTSSVFLVYLAIAHFILARQVNEPTVRERWLLFSTFVFVAMT